MNSAFFPDSLLFLAGVLVFRYTALNKARVKIIRCNNALNMHHGDVTPSVWHKHVILYTLPTSQIWWC